MSSVTADIALYRAPAPPAGMEASAAHAEQRATAVARKEYPTGKIVAIVAP
jgi:hypothetical protein